MTFPHILGSVRATPSILVLVTTILVAPAAFAQSTWQSTNTGTVNWSTPAAWNVAPVSSIDATLTFSGANPNIYIANDDIAGAFQLNKLTLNSTATSVET